MRPLVFAHRGGAGLTPENTIAAFDRGLALGADGIEFDVHLSKDGVPVIIHDATVDRTTDGTGAVADLTAAELGALDAGYRFDEAGGFRWRGRAGGVPTLETMLARYGGQRLIVELKTPEPGLARLVLDMIRGAGLGARVTVGSFHDAALQTVRAYAPEIRTGATTAEIKAALTGELSALGAPLPFEAFQVPLVFNGQPVVSEAFVRGARAAGAGFTVWIVNDPDDIRRLLGWGVNGIITDRPDVAVPTVHAWASASVSRA